MAWVGCRVFFAVYFADMAQRAPEVRAEFAPHRLVAQLAIAPQVETASPKAAFRRWKKPGPIAGLAADTARQQAPQLKTMTTTSPERAGPAPPLPGLEEVPAARSSARRDSWSLAAFALYRPDSGAGGLLPNGQLGGSQAGIRVQRRLFSPNRRLDVSLNFRASAPLETPLGKEVGVGLAVRLKGRVPVELIAERRIGIDRGGRDAYAGLVTGGFDDLRLPGRILLSGYAQAGIVGLKRRDGFADGAIRAEHDLLRINGVGVRVGAGISGGVQPGISRLDISPGAALRFRIGKAGARLGGEWRNRIAGNARPGSGPAVTLGLDY